MNNVKKFQHPKPKSYADYVKEDKTLSKEDKRYSLDCFRSVVRFNIDEVKVKNQPPFKNRFYY